MKEEWKATGSERLDLFLSRQHGVISRGNAQNLIDSGAVLLNGSVIRKPAYRLKDGDVVTCDFALLPLSESSIIAEQIDLPILYEDDACLVLNKPAGLTVHPGAGTKGATTLLHGIAHLFNERSLPFLPDSVLVHRLDKDTTGCLLIAKTAEAHRFFQKQFADRTVQKTYLVLVEGIPQHAQALIDAPVGRHVTQRTKMSVRGGGRSREARTSYRVLAHSGTVALLACDLHTGRTHQIRVHLASIGHPVLGDETYASKTSGSLSRALDVRSICLHAWKLRFVSPADQMEHEVKEDPPPAFRRTLDHLGLGNIR